MAQRVEPHPLDAAFAALLAKRLDGGAGEALRILVNEASKIERAHFLNAQPHERTTERIDYANGFKPKTVMTRLGEQTLRHSPRCGGGFYPSALWRRARAPNRRCPTWPWPRCTSRDHVVALDQQDYAWAMVVGPDRDYLWILSRNKQLPATSPEQLISSGESPGF